MHIIKKSLFQSGETIVEVLVAIVVISTAVGGAYAIANRSKGAIQTSQEHYQAQLYANQQADLLRLYVPAGSNRATLPSNFCLTDATTKYPNTPPSSYNASCVRDSLYKINVSVQSTTAKYTIFDITVQWDSLIRGVGQEKVELIYGT